MVAYYGGRAECRIRRVPVPVVYVDFLSMYPTVNTLMGLWRYITAERVEPRDASSQTRVLLDAITLEDCFNRRFWPQLLTLVRVEPEGDVLPTRADYGENGQWQIGLNPVRSDVPLWYALPDVIAAKLLTGKTPTITEAIRLEAIGQQEGLRRIRIAGEIEINPSRQDFFASLIEQRRQVRQRDDLDPDAKEGLQEFLKVLASSGCYGIFAEINRSDLGSRRAEVTVHGLNERFAQRLSSVEEPGAYSFPPLAACITAAARLMLAMLERLVTDASGTYAFCDTDSMAIVATPAGDLVACDGGPLATETGHPAIRSLSFAEVDAIIDRFAALNPYHPELVKGSILELEDWNLDPGTHERRQLFCYSISAKRYVLYNVDSAGVPKLRKASEHGLGHLLNPIDPDADNRDLAHEVWQEILANELG
jgi:hypothetical protein